MISIIRFDLGRQLRAISTWVYFAILAAIAYLSMIAAGGAFSSLSVTTGGGKVFINSAYSLAQLISLFSYFGLLIISAITGKAAFQDFEANSHSFFFTMPISKGSYLFGRFAAAMIALMVIFSSLAIGLAIATKNPLIDHVKVAPNYLWEYVQPYLTSVIPNVFVMGALFFSLAALTRRAAPVYMTSVILLVGYLIALDVSQRLQDRTIAGLVDPFGSVAMDHVTRYWTIADKNARVIPLEGEFLWNRLIWIGIGAALLGFTYARFKFVYAMEGRREKIARDEAADVVVITERPRITPEFSALSAFRSTMRLAKLGLVETVKNIYFLVIVLAGIMFMIFAARTAGDLYGTPTYPVTYQMTELVGGTFGLFMLIIITFYSGELVWRERDAKTNELIDALPLPNWSLYLSKLFALMGVVVVLNAVIIVTGIVIQLFKGYTHFEIGLYVKELFGLKMIADWLICALAITVQSIVNNKYMGHFVMVLYYLLRAFMGQLGLQHHLYNFPTNPGYTYSDMNRFGHFLAPVFWFDGYWTAFAVLLLVVGYLYFVRGLATDGGWRSKTAGVRFHGTPRVVAGLAMVAFVAIGGFIYWNTNVRNIYRTSKQQELLQVRYEREYKKYLDVPQPRITSVRFDTDLDPYARTVKVTGHYDLVNKNDRPVDTLLVGISEDLPHTRLKFTPPAKMIDEQRPMDLAVYRLERPLQPGESGGLDFELGYEPHGFPNQTDETYVVYNGTFFNSQLLPQFGYQEGQEVGDDATRRKYGLPEKPRMADLNDVKARMNTYISNDSDWVPFQAHVCTAADQIAIAPGELTREWSEGAKHCYEYRTLRPVLNFFSVLSARYAVVRDKWQDVELGIYYHPGHEYNLKDMMDGMKASLAYCSANFSPYQNKTLRIIEFPRYEEFAQSFPASIPYSESIGFIAKVDPSSDEDVDYPYYVTAHEVAHQWWAHQVIGANVQGGTMLSESLAQYTAMMVMKKKVGEAEMRRFLKYEMDRYLQGRAVERKKELPLDRVENQPYIHYNKASVIFYALQDYVGEDKLNAVLHDYVAAVAFQNPPYTISTDLVDRIRKIVPPEYAYIVDDMFDTITLYENRALSASYKQRADGKYEVSLKVAAKKVRASELGDEKEMPLGDWIDIGVLDKDGKALAMERRKIEKAESEFSFVVDREPAKAGIDPWNKLVDRKPDDNVMVVTKM